MLAHDDGGKSAEDALTPFAADIETIEMRVTELGPLGLCFGEEVRNFSWKVQNVKEGFICASTLQLGDELVAVNNRSVEGLPPCDVVSAMKERPVDLIFWRRLQPGGLLPECTQPASSSAPSAAPPRPSPLRAPQRLAPCGPASAESSDNAARSAALLERLKMEVEVCSSEVWPRRNGCGGADVLPPEAPPGEPLAAPAAALAAAPLPALDAGSSAPAGRHAAASWLDAGGPPLGGGSPAAASAAAAEPPRQPPEPRVPEPKALVERLLAQDPSAGTGNALDARRMEILDFIEAHDISFIQAATGMGKSTRIPQFVIDKDPSFQVWQLQPRRLAAKRLAEYLSRTRGEEVGYRVRADNRVGPTTRLTYMTTGYFLHFVLHQLPRMTSSSVSSAKWCTHLFVDEVHESNEETELCLLFVKMLSRFGKLPFKVVVLSATLDFQLYRDYFGRPEVSSDEEDEAAAPELAASSGGDSDGPGLPEGQEAEDLDGAAAAAGAGAAAEAGGAWPPPAGEEPAPSAPRRKRRQVLVPEDAGPSLGLVFKYESEEGGNKWTIREVRPWSVAFGSVRVGDFLSEIDDRSVVDLPNPEIQALLKGRPLKLHFGRPPRTDPPNVAETLLDLAIETPFPVEIIYLDDVHELGIPEFAAHKGPVPFNTQKHSAGLGPEPAMLELCAILLMHECCSPDLNALVFLPGISEIEHFARVLEKRLRECGASIDIVILHSITLAESSEVRTPLNPTVPTAYIASAIAETSITLPELSVVFDFGLARGSVFDQVLEMEQLTTRLASKTSGTQRKGRVGRTKPGKVYRLYPKITWDNMPAVDNWGAQQNLDRTILLITRTLVRFLGMEVRELLRMLVQRPGEEQMDLAIARLEDMDALCKGKNDAWALTAFGEFAVCIAVLGPRLARLVYCGAIFNCTRMAIALAAVHTVCGKGEIFQVPHDVMNRGAAREGEPIDLGRQTKVEFTFVELSDPGITKLGIVFCKFHEREPGKGWQVRRVIEGSWAESNGVLVDDYLNEIYTEVGGRVRITALQEVQIIELLRHRPVTLFFERLIMVDPEEQKAEDSLVWDRKTLGLLVRVARLLKQNDDGYLCEPVVGLRLFSQYLKRKLPQEDAAVISMHKLRQIDGACREVCSKLRSLCKDARVGQERRGKGAGKGRPRQRVLARLREDAAFWGCNYDESLANRGPGGVGSWLGDMGPEELAYLRLVLCAAFPGNFLFGSLLPKREKPREEEPPPPPPPPLPAPDEPGVDSAPPPPPPPAEAPRPAEAAEDEEPPLTLRSAPPAFSAELISRLVRETYRLPEGPLLVPAPNQRPGNWVVSFPGEFAAAEETIDRLTHLNSACLLNMLAQRDHKSRLQLVFDNSVVPCGELHVTPALEWRLMRMPQLSVKPAPKLTLLSRLGPVPGLGPPLQQEGPGAEGTRLGLAMELEAFRMNQKKGRTFRGGKAIRSWLVSCLPSKGGLDIALMLTFWSKDMLLQPSVPEGSSQSSDDTEYSAVAVGRGFSVRFPQPHPLRASALKELGAFHRAVRHAHRTGNVYDRDLPSIAGLLMWGRTHLPHCELVPEEKFGASLALQSLRQPYTHKQGYGAITLKAAPVRALGTLRGHPPARPSGKCAAAAREPPAPSRPPRAAPRLGAPRWAEHWRAAARAPRTRGVPRAGPAPPWEAECVVELPGAREAAAEPAGAPLAPGAPPLHEECAAGDSSEGSASDAPSAA